MKTNKFISWLRRYAVGICVLAGVVYVIFFTKESMAQNEEYNHTIDSLQTSIQFYSDTLRYYDSLNRRLSVDPQTMERVVREEYHMHRPGEEIYIVE